MNELLNKPCPECGAELRYQTGPLDSILYDEPMYCPDCDYEEDLTNSA